MARSPLFRRVRRLMKVGQVANQMNLSDRDVCELLDRGRFSKSRREFIRHAAIGAAGAVAVSMFDRNQLFAQTAHANEDVLILGAGAAGLAAAYTLGKANVGYKLVDANKAGLTGRIFTYKNFNPDGQFIELGGELVDSGHVTIQALCAELGLPLDDFADNDKDVADEVFLYEGTAYTDDQFVAAIRDLLGKIADLNSQILPSADLQLTYQFAGKLPPIAAVYDKMSLQEFFDKNSAGLPKWAAETLRMAYLGENGREVDEQSALNMITMIDTDVDKKPFQMFGSSDEAHRVRGGSMTLTSTLYNAVTNKGTLASNSLADDGQKALYEHTLIKMARASNGKIVCYFQGPSGSPVRIEASQVICTIPFSVLRGVEGINKLGLTNVKQDCISNCGYGTNSKLMMGFKSKFWRQPGGTVPANTGYSFLADPVQCFWETSRLQPGQRGILTNFMGGRAGANADRLTKSAGSNATVRAALKELNLYYPNSKDQFEDRFFVMNWSKQRTTLGSYSCNMPGQYLRFVGSAQETELGGQLLFAGEHTSPDFPGFMEGAYESGVRAAEELMAARNVIFHKLKAG